MAAMNTTTTAFAVATGYVVAGFALQHAAYILQYGSIFNSLRRWLERKACGPAAGPFSRWVCSKVREAISCQLCSITQLSIYFCAIPATVAAVAWGGSRPFGLTPLLAVWGYLLFGLGVLFSTAAVGLVCWDVARMVGRGSDAIVLYLRARTAAAEAEARVRKLQADAAIQAQAELILKRRSRRRRPDAFLRSAGPLN
jgi:hypothetical protein